MYYYVWFQLWTLNRLLPKGKETLTETGTSFLLTKRPLNRSFHPATTWRGRRLCPHRKPWGGRARGQPGWLAEHHHRYGVEAGALMSGCFSLGMVRCRVLELTNCRWLTRPGSLLLEILQSEWGMVQSALDSGSGLGRLFLSVKWLFSFSFLTCIFRCHFLSYHVCALGFSKLYFFYDIV